LLKTFWGGPNGRRDQQHPGGTITWTAPSGHMYTTRPGSRLLLPSLCLPTGQLPTAPAAELPTSQCGTQERQNDLQLQEAFLTFGKTTRLGNPDDLAAITTFLLSQ
jgi:hypothetical protein